MKLSRVAAALAATAACSLALAPRPRRSQGAWQPHERTMTTRW